MTITGWRKTAFEGVDTFGNTPDALYCHDYSSAGLSKVLRAAEQHIESKTEDDDRVRRVALILLDNEGATTDLYQQQSNERWVVDTGPIMVLAREIVEAIT